jgi:hypothetical protein
VVLVFDILRVFTQLVVLQQYNSTTCRWWLMQTGAHAAGSANSLHLPCITQALAPLVPTQADTHWLQLRIIN